MSVDAIQLPGCCDSIVTFRKNARFPNIYDIGIDRLEQCAHYDSIECHVVLYPYSRKITSEHIIFTPFEEYAKDILTEQKSAYIKINSQFHKIFGILLGVLIATIFVWWKPDSLFSIDAVLSLLGAYFIGKDLWYDIEKLLIGLSKTWKLRYLENYYAYQLGTHTTLTHYSYFAKAHRYGKVPLLPEKMDFIEQSNSQTLRMCFDRHTLQTLPQSSAHILSIHIDPALVDEFEEAGFMFGVKLSFNKQVLGVTKSLEWFQSLHQQATGCLDEHGRWVAEAMFYRRTFRVGRIKMFLQSGLLHQKKIIT